MPEIRLSINENFINTLKEESGIDRTSQLTTEALSLLKWAISEAKEGRVLVTTDRNGENVRRVVMPSLQNAMEKGNGVVAASNKTQ